MADFMEPRGAPATGHVAIDETDRLIASDKVEGTAVFGRDGERLGAVRNFMVDKFTGRVAYAVMSCGAPGAAERHYPLPWKALTYDTARGGYVVDLDRSALARAPSHAPHETPDWNGPNWGVRLYDYYKVEAYWGV